MDSALLTIFYSLGSILFLMNAGLAFQILPLRGYRRAAGFFIAAYLCLGVAFITNLVMLLVAGDNFLITVPGILLVVGSGAIFLAATRLIEKRLKSQAEEQNREHLLLEESQQSNQVFLQSFNGLAIPVAIKDKHRRYLYCNLAYADFINQKVEDLIGQTDDTFLPTEEAAEHQRIEERVSETGQPATRKKQMNHKTGVVHYSINWSIGRNPGVDEAVILIWVLDVSRESEAGEQCSRWQKAASALAEAEVSLTRSPISNLANQEYFNRILILFASLAGTQNVAIWHASGDPISAVCMQGLGKTVSFKGIRVRSGEDVAGQVLQTGKLVEIVDYHKFPGTLHWSQEIHMGAAVGLPLRNKEQLANIVTIFWELPKSNLTPEILQILEIFSSSISADLANSTHLDTLAQEIADWQRKLSTLQFRVRLEHVIAMIAAHFIGLPAEKVDEGIIHSLQTISKIAAIERSYLVLFAREDIAELKRPIRYSSQANDGKSLFEQVVKEDEKWYPMRINQGEVVAVSTVDGLQDEEEGDFSTLRQRGVKSYYAFPLVSNRSVIGYLGFESLRGEVDWTVDVISLMKIAADMFVNLFDRKWSARLQMANQERLNRTIRELEVNNQENLYIAQMGDLLQACRTSDEAFPIITRYLQRLLPEASGALYMIQDTKDPAEKVAEWACSDQHFMEQELIQNECWSLRRGRAYYVEDPAVEPVCGHIKESIPSGYMCVPLLAHGVAAGVLHLRSEKKLRGQASFTEAQQQLANRVAEYIAMPITNLRLRDDLRSQAIRDPLTNLFNRRYMEETLEREIRRAIRHQTSVGIIMFDIDKMKPINDLLGHDAGDLLLKTLGRELLGMFRGEDVACRYGGDEFTIVLPEAGLAEVWRRAEQMRENIKRLNLVYDGKPLGQINLSIGVAAFPDHGQTAEKVILAADAASYASKTEGGDRIMLGRKTDT